MRPPDGFTLLDLTNAIYDLTYKRLNHSHNGALIYPLSPLLSTTPQGYCGYLRFGGGPPGDMMEITFWWAKYYRNGPPYPGEHWDDQGNRGPAVLEATSGAVAAGRPVLPKADRIRFEELAADFLNDCRVNNKRALLRVSLKNSTSPPTCPRNRGRVGMGPPPPS